MLRTLDLGIRNFKALRLENSVLFFKHKNAMVTISYCVAFVFV